MSRLKDCFNNHKVLVTGHTGFKGSWLTIWLLELGAEVVGFSNGIPSEPSHFRTAQLETGIRSYIADIRDFSVVMRVVQDIQPDFVFHLAAQALVRRSYSEPLLTLETNALGTANILEALRILERPCVAVLITSDKCYDNVEWVWGYRETDRLGGKDPYSASKGAAEIIIRSYLESFMPMGSPTRVGICRAGNVIGGGDWADDRIVPDCVRAWGTGQVVTIRNPSSTRPWQHVLEPLSGYLALATALAESDKLHGQAFNFGPLSSQNRTVGQLLDALIQHWDGASWVRSPVKGDTHPEAGLLKLNCDKALHFLNWQSTLEFAEMVRFTAQWYRKFYSDPPKSMIDITLTQLKEYLALAKSRGSSWAQ